MAVTLRTNSNIAFQCAFHVVWCPKCRRRVLGGRIQERLKQIIGEVIEEKGAWLVELEVMPDHVHLLVEVGPQFGIHRLVKAIKGRSSRVLRQEYPALLTGRRYRAYLDIEQAEYAESIGAACRSVWNTGLYQRREYRRRGAWMNYVPQARELAEAKTDHTWLKDVPGHCLQQTLMDLDRACRAHGTWRVRWRSKSRWAPSFRFPEGAKIRVERLGRKWGRAKRSASTEASRLRRPPATATSTIGPSSPPGKPCGIGACSSSSPAPRREAATAPRFVPA